MFYCSLVNIIERYLRESFLKFFDNILTSLLELIEYLWQRAYSRKLPVFTTSRRALPESRTRFDNDSWKRIFCQSVAGRPEAAVQCGLLIRLVVTSAEGLLQVLTRG
mgnify:FL=1